MSIDLPLGPADYQPRFPAGSLPGIGIIGCGSIVRQAHLPAYAKYGLNVVGVYDPNPEATRDVDVRQVYPSVEALLADPEIAVVDIATHPAPRAALIQTALAAGKHVLSQKPLAVDLPTARALVAAAAERGLTFAVNQNGRWAPPWRIASLLVERGVIGEVVSVTHQIERAFGWIPGTPFDEIAHFAIYDYAIHWIDITRCWLDGQPVATVRARDYRTPNQPAEGKTPWGMWIEIAYANGAHAMIRALGAISTVRQGHHFWVHGASGTIRGSLLAGGGATGGDAVELERDGAFHTFPLHGAWFPDGFAGTMGELLCAIAEEREPSNSARHNLLSLEMTLAACRSADGDGVAIPISQEG